MTRAAPFYAARFFFGGWFLFHGLNYWLHYFPEPSFAPGARGFIPELIRLGLFAMVKVMEVLIGAALLADLFAPLAIVAAVPITLVIAQLNIARGTAFGLSVGIVILALNAVMAAGHLDRYRPMLAMRGGRPGGGVGLRVANGVAPILDDRRLPPRTHMIAALLGIAGPAALTYASIHWPTHHASAASRAISPSPPR